MGAQIAEALKAADPETGGKRAVDVDSLATEFESRIAAILTRFDGLDRENGQYEALQAALERLPDAENREEYRKEFTGIETLWEFLYPHETLDPHRDDYRWLSQIYAAIQPANSANAILWHRLGPKTLALVHGNTNNVKVTGTGLEEIVVDPDAISAMRKLIEQGELPFDVDRDLVKDPITVDEAFTAIERRIKRLMAEHPHKVYQSLAEKLEKLRKQALDKAEDSIAFLKKALEVARLAVQAERLDAEGRLDAEAEHLLSPNIGALTQIMNEYAPDQTPVIVNDVVRDIDNIAQQVAYTGWGESQPGDREARKQIKLVLNKYALPPSGELFNETYAYIRENY
jgi:type I restriction enzyme R subunit